MEEKKKSKRVVWMVTTITVLILGIIGYIVYDNFLKVDKTVPNYDNTSTTTTTTTSNVEETNYLTKLNYPKENDKNIILSGNLSEFINDYSKDLNFKINNIEINYKTKECNEEMGGCSGVLYYKNLELGTIDTYLGETDIELLITDKYIISYESGFWIKGNIKIIDYNGVLIKSINNVISHCELYDEETSLDWNIFINNNELYYIIDNKEIKTVNYCNGTEKVNELIIKKYSLSTLEEYDINKFEGILFPGC